MRWTLIPTGRGVTVRTWDEIRGTYVALSELKAEAQSLGKSVEQKLDVIAARLLVLIDLSQEIADNTKPRQVMINNHSTPTPYPTDGNGNGGNQGVTR